LFTIQQKCYNFVGSEIVNKRYSQLLKERENNFKRYFEKNGIELILPSQTDQNKLTQVILNILAGKKLDEDKEQMKAIIAKMKQGGAEAVVLACTDLPILLKQEDVDIPVFDTVEILAEATVQYAISKIGNEILE